MAEYAEGEDPGRGISVSIFTRRFAPRSLRNEKYNKLGKKRPSRPHGGWATMVQVWFADNVGAYLVHYY